MLFEENTLNLTTTKFCIKNPNVEYDFELYQGSKPIEIKTIEAVPVTCHPGDYIITGVIGEQWVVNHKKFEVTYIPTNDKQTKIKGKVRANPDSKIKRYDPNEINESGKLLLSWGTNGTVKTVYYSEADVLIYDEAGYKYPYKKKVFEKTYLVSESKEELKQQFAEKQAIKIQNIRKSFTSFESNYEGNSSQQSALDNYQTRTISRLSLIDNVETPSSSIIKESLINNYLENNTKQLSADSELDIGLILIN